MAAKTRTLTFNGNNITFLRWGKHWVVPAKLLGQALGYSSNGDKLATLISGGWKKEFQYMAISGVLAIPKEANKVDAMLLASSALSTFKSFSGQTTTAPRMLVLTMSGVIRVLGKSRAKMASAFRDFLATNGGELLNGFELPPSQGGSGAELAQSAPTEIVQSSPLDDLLRVFHTMTDKGLISKKDQKQTMKNLLDIQAARVSKEAGLTHFLTDGKTPPTETKALAKNAMAVPEGNFKVVSTDSPYHPDYKDWLPASDIGAPWLLKGDLVKKYCKAFCVSRGFDLPNNDAKKFVENNNGNFPKPDEKGFIIFKPNHVNGIALYMQMEGNQMNWRNYWSPAAVQDIRDLITVDKGSPLPNLANTVRLEIAGNIFREIEVLGSSLRSDTAEAKFRDECKKKTVRFGENLTFMKDFLDSKAVDGGVLLRWKNKNDPKMFLYTKITESNIDEAVWGRSEPMKLAREEEPAFFNPDMNFEKDRAALPNGEVYLEPNGRSELGEKETTMFGGGGSSNPPQKALQE